MSFLFKRNKHNSAKDEVGLGVRGPSAGNHTPKKLLKNTRRHSSSRSKAPAALGAAGESGSSSDGGNRLPGIADMILDPHQYTELLLQASAVRDEQKQQQQDPSYTSATDLKVPPPTPFRQNSIRETNQEHQRCQSQPRLQSQSADSQVPRALGNGNCDIADAIIGGVTYDAILVSTVNRRFSGAGFMTEDDDDDGTMGRTPPPETRVPPNSPAVSLRLRRSGGGGDNEFGSLVGVTLAIMENRVQAV
ncbi:hypothetical protein CVT25_013174 [Psilocybe cyanescens]|uniref:Uncharacterized protein n=1 Tax=Psilocybe cyanescens TaxID=93625 RepID=A0A409XCR8_PSICY|nr:hypothetical protein CVT25_013174 [Psilocybe cyanescens]